MRFPKRPPQQSTTHKHQPSPGIRIVIAYDDQSDNFEYLDTNSGIYDSRISESTGSDSIYESGTLNLNATLEVPSFSFDSGI